MVSIKLVVDRTVAPAACSWARTGSCSAQDALAPDVAATGVHEPPSTTIMVLGWPLAATGAWAVADGSATNPAASRTAVAVAKETLPPKRGMQSSPSN